MSMAMTSSADDKKPVGRLLVLFVLFLMILGGAFALLTALVPAPALVADTPPPPLAAPAEPLAVAASSAELAAQADLGAVLVWLGGGAAPGRHSASAPGQLALLDSSGAVVPVMDIPPQTSRVAPCGISADGTLRAFYLGGDSGALYLMRGTDAPVKVDDVQALACLGAGQAQFSADGARLAYIAYKPGATQTETAEGFLRVVSTATLQREFSDENATAFRVTPTGAAYVSLFANNRGEAVEAAVMTWNGSARRELATLTPTGENCRYTSGQIALAGDGRLLLVMGQRCRGAEARTQWQLYVVNPEAGSATLAASDYQPGAFVPYARTNDIFFSPDGSRAYFTVPDGFAANTVGIKALRLSDLAVTTVIERQAVMSNFSGAANAFPLTSTDGRWLALVVTTPNNENTLNIFDLADPTVAPITLSAGSRGDVVSAMSFTPDSRQLFVVAGGVDSANNSLFSVDLASGSSSRVTRGRFGAALAVLRDGTHVALPDWQIPDDTRQPAYANMIVLNTATNEVATWFTGAEIVDGKVTNQRFAFPMMWR